MFSYYDDSYGYFYYGYMDGYMNEDDYDNVNNMEYHTKTLNNMLSNKTSKNVLKKYEYHFRNALNERPEMNLDIVFGVYEKLGEPIFRIIVSTGSNEYMLSELVDHIISKKLRFNLTNKIFNQVVRYNVFCIIDYYESNHENLSNYRIRKIIENIWKSNKETGLYTRDFKRICNFCVKHKYHTKKSMKQNPGRWVRLISKCDSLSKLKIMIDLYISAGCDFMEIHEVIKSNIFCKIDIYKYVLYDMEYNMSHYFRDTHYKDIQFMYGCILDNTPRINLKKCSIKLLLGYKVHKSIVNDKPQLFINIMKVNSEHEVLVKFWKYNFSRIFNYYSNLPTIF